jgi:hypothetical protein
VELVQPTNLGRIEVVENRAGVTERSSGLTKKRSATSTRASRRLGSRKVASEVGLRKTARLRAW